MKAKAVNCKMRNGLFLIVTKLFVVWSISSVVQADVTEVLCPTFPSEVQLVRTKITGISSAFQCFEWSHSLEDNGENWQYSGLCCNEDGDFIRFPDGRNIWISGPKCTMEEKDRIFRREQKSRLDELQKKFRKKWDALEMLVSEDEENVAFIAARGEKRYFYETKDGKLTLLQKVKKDTAAYLDYKPIHKLLVFTSYSDNGMNLILWSRNGMKKEYHGDYLQLVTCKSGYGVEVLDPEGNHYFEWASGLRISVPEKRTVFAIFSEQKPLLLQYRDGHTNAFYLGEKLLAKGSILINLAHLRKSPYDYLIYAFDGRNATITSSNGDVFSYENAYWNGISENCEKWSLCVFNPENPCGDTFLLLSDGQKLGPFADIGNVFFRHDASSWAAVVQTKEDKRYTVLYNGIPGQKYDNILRLESYPESDHCHTYGLRDGKWYRIDIQLD